MSTPEVTHKEIYDRLLEVETKVDKLSSDTEGIVKAFNDAQGAFHVLEWIAKIAKPVLFTVGAIAAIVAMFQDYRSH